ncbi:unnamed protein product [Closterium sp. Naga37s-1]|nr:unnamed protein product [Closterium sp. Naga37s-1]CAI5485808.1 unnamed protein product [Closterium sp. Naga37s-1]
METQGKTNEGIRQRKKAGGNKRLAQRDKLVGDGKGNGSQTRTERQGDEILAPRDAADTARNQGEQEDRSSGGGEESTQLAPSGTGGEDGEEEQAEPREEAPMGPAGEKARPEAQQLAMAPRVEGESTDVAEAQQQAEALATGTAATMLTGIAREEAAAARMAWKEQVAVGGADRLLVVGQQESAEVGGEYGMTLRAHECMGGSAHEEIDKSDPGGARGLRPPCVRPGQRRLGAGLVPARPGPLAGNRRTMRGRRRRRSRRGGGEGGGSGGTKAASWDGSAEDLARAGRAQGDDAADAKHGG